MRVKWTVAGEFVVCGYDNARIAKGEPVLLLYANHDRPLRRCVEHASQLGYAVDAEAIEAARQAQAPIEPKPSAAPAAQREAGDETEFSGVDRLAARLERSLPVARRRAAPLKKYSDLPPDVRAREERIGGRE